MSDRIDRVRDALYSGCLQNALLHAQGDVEAVCYVQQAALLFPYIERRFEFRLGLCDGAGPYHYGVSARGHGVGCGSAWGMCYVQSVR